MPHSKETGSKSNPVSNPISVPVTEGLLLCPGPPLGGYRLPQAQARGDGVTEGPTGLGLLLSLCQRTSSLSGRGLYSLPPRPQDICPHPHALPQETLATLGDTKERAPEQEVLVRKQVKFRLVAQPNVQQKAETSSQKTLSECCLLASPGDMRRVPLAWCLY